MRCCYHYVFDSLLVHSTLMNATTSPRQGNTYRSFRRLRPRCKIAVDFRASSTMEHLRRNRSGRLPSCVLYLYREVSKNTPHLRRRGHFLQPLHDMRSQVVVKTRTVHTHSHTRKVVEESNISAVGCLCPARVRRFAERLRVRSDRQQVERRCCHVPTGDLEVLAVSRGPGSTAPGVPLPLQADATRVQLWDRKGRDTKYRACRIPCFPLPPHCMVSVSVVLACRSFHVC